GRARFDTQVAVDATQIVDLVDVAVALARRHGIVDGIVGAAHVDALRRAHAGAELAADALLHAVLVTVEDVPAVQARRLLALDLRVLGGEARLEHLPQRDAEAGQTTHQRNSSTISPDFGIARYSVPNAAIAMPAETGATTYQCQPCSRPTSS